MKKIELNLKFLFLFIKFFEKFLKLVSLFISLKLTKNKIKRIFIKFTLLLFY